MSEADTEYFRQRAAREREMAKNAPTPKIAAIHEELARGYDLLVKESPGAQQPAALSSE